MKRTTDDIFAEWNALQMYLCSTKGALNISLQIELVKRLLSLIDEVSEHSDVSEANLSVLSYDRYHLRRWLATVNNILNKKEI